MRAVPIPAGASTTDGYVIGSASSNPNAPVLFMGWSLHAASAAVQVTWRDAASGNVYASTDIASGGGSTEIFPEPVPVNGALYADLTTSGGTLSGVVYIK